CLGPCPVGLVLIKLDRRSRRAAGGIALGFARLGFFRLKCSGLLLQVCLAQNQKLGKIGGVANLLDANALPCEKFAVVRYVGNRMAQDEMQSLPLDLFNELKRGKLKAA